MTCKDCNGTGTIELFTSRVPCDCTRTRPVLPRTPLPDVRWTEFDQAILAGVKDEIRWARDQVRRFHEAHPEVSFVIDEIRTVKDLRTLFPDE